MMTHSFERAQGDARGRATRRGAAMAGLIAIAVLTACTGAQDTDPTAAVENGAAGGDTVPGAVPDTDKAPDLAIAPEAELTPGQFSSPLVRLKRLQGRNGHMHTDEVRYRASDKLLFQCSYTFNVISASNPATMTFLVEGLTHKIPDDERSPGCVHLAYDGDIVYTTHRGNLRNPTYVSGWDISKRDAEDPTKWAPEQIPVLQEAGVSYEGVDVADGVLYAAIREDGLAAYRRDPATNVLTRIGSLGDLGNTWGIRVADNKAYVTHIGGGLSVVDVSDPEHPTLLGTVETGGVAKGVAVDGKTAYVAGGSAGLVIVDVGDPAAPKVIATQPTLGPAVRVAYSDGHAFVAAWTDFRAYDVKDPANPHFIGATRLTMDANYPDGDGHPPITGRTMGIAADGNNIFVGNWWVPYSYRLYADREAPSMVLHEDINLLDVGQVAAGQTVSTELPVRNQGTAPLTVYNVWSENPAFSVTPNTLRILPGEEGMLNVSFTSPSAERTTSLLNMYSDDPQQPQRIAYLVANIEGLGVGQPLPETRVALVDGGEWSSADTKGKVTVLAYFATFCPVCSVHVPELESHFWHKYKDQDVVIVALDSHDQDMMEGVKDYIGRYNNTHPAGIESADTKTYAALTKNYKGANPFPVDVVVGKDGVITYIVREYDPAGLEAAIDNALAD